MVLKCCIRNCSTYSNNGKYKLFRFPTISKCADEKTRNSQELHQAEWSKACGLKNSPASYHRVCAQHFVSGRSACPENSNHVDWTPTLDLEKHKVPGNGKIDDSYSRAELPIAVDLHDVAENPSGVQSISDPSPQPIEVCYPDQLEDYPDGQPIDVPIYRPANITHESGDYSNRRKVDPFDEYCHPASAMEISLDALHSSIPITNNVSSDPDAHVINTSVISEPRTIELQNTDDFLVLMDLNNDSGIYFVDNDPESTMQSNYSTLSESGIVYKSDACVQTESCIEKEINGWKNSLIRYETEITKLKAHQERLIRDLTAAKEAAQFTVSALEKNNKKCRYFTGLDCGVILKRLFEALAPAIPTYEGLDKEKTFILALRKLRLNEPFCSLGYAYNLSQTSISTYFYETINAICPFMNALVKFPARSVLKQHMPTCFRQKYKDAVTVIIDCFEVFIESPSTKSMVANANVFSNYKKHKTVKVLVGISAAGSIIYISEAFGGRTSDKEIVKMSGFLNKIEDGDFIMADRGFLIEDLLAPHNATVSYPAFKKKDHQLEPLDAIQSKELSALRIHVERLIGVLRQKFLILTDKIPMYMLQRWNMDTPAFDQILMITAALVNLCPSVVTP